MYFHVASSPSFLGPRVAYEAQVQRPLSIPASWVDVAVCDIARSFVGSDDRLFTVGGDRVARFTRGTALGRDSLEIACFHDTIANAAAAGDPFPASKAEAWRGMIDQLIRRRDPRNALERTRELELVALADRVARHAREAAAVNGVQDIRPLMPQLRVIEETLSHHLRHEHVDAAVQHVGALLPYADGSPVGRLSQRQFAQELEAVRTTLQHAREVVATELQEPNASPGLVPLFKLLDECARLVDLAERRLDPRGELAVAGQVAPSLEWVSAEVGEACLQQV